MLVQDDLGMSLTGRGTVAIRWDPLFPLK